MKKGNLLTKTTMLTACFLFSSCSKEYVTENENFEQENPYLPFTEMTWTDPHIDYRRAVQLAQNAHSFFDPGRAVTKASEVVVYPSEPIMNPVQTKSGADTLMYVFNYADGGYTIISTDARIGDVIAYVEKGSFNIRDTVDNELSAFLVGLMINYHENKMDELFEEDPGIVQFAGDPGMPGAPGSKATWAGRSYVAGPNCVAAERKLPRSPDDLVATPPPPQAMDGDEYYRRNGCIMSLTESRTKEASRGPYLKTEWNQNKPYNNYAPKKNDKSCVAGCTAIALSQIMAYHSHPERIPSGGNFAGELTYLSTHRKKASLDTLLPPPMVESLPKFIRRVGDELNNKWGIDGTAANAGNFWELEWGNFFGQPYVIKCLKTFGFTSPEKLANYDFAIVESSLNGGCPVYISGYMDWLRSNGHAWVIDGYKVNQMKQKRYNYYFDANGNYNKKILEMEYEPYQYAYVHCNFGWGGSYNGYYPDGIFDIHKKDETDKYKYRLRVLTNIKKK